MSRIDPPTESEMGRLERELLERVEEIHGFVPNQHALDAHVPLLLRSLVDLNRRVLLAGDLDPLFLEKLALLISVENGCEYCVGYHETALEGRANPEEIRTLVDDWRAAEFTALERTMVDLALAANEDPHAVTDEQVEAVMDAGATAADLVQLMHFVTVIQGYNTFNVVFQTDLDEHSDSWLD